MTNIINIIANVIKSSKLELTEKNVDAILNKIAKEIPDSYDKDIIGVWSVAASLDDLINIKIASEESDAAVKQLIAKVNEIIETRKSQGAPVNAVLSSLRGALLQYNLGGATIGYVKSELGRLLKNPVPVVEPLLDDIQKIVDIEVDSVAEFSQKGKEIKKQEKLEKEKGTAKATKKKENLLKKEEKKKLDETLQKKYDVSLEDLKERRLPTDMSEKKVKERQLKKELGALNTKIKEAPEDELKELKKEKDILLKDMTQTKEVATSEKELEGKSLESQIEELSRRLNLYLEDFKNPEIGKKTPVAIELQKRIGKLTRMIIRDQLAANDLEDVKIQERIDEINSLLLNDANKLTPGDESRLKEEVTSLTKKQEHNLKMEEERRIEFPKEYMLTALMQGEGYIGNSIDHITQANSQLFSSSLNKEELAKHLFRANQNIVGAYDMASRFLDFRTRTIKAGGEVEDVVTIDFGNFVMDLVKAQKRVKELFKEAKSMGIDPGSVAADNNQAIGAGEYLEKDIIKDLDDIEQKLTGEDIQISPGGKAWPSKFEKLKTVNQSLYSEVKRRWLPEEQDVVYEEYNLKPFRETAKQEANREFDLSQQRKRLDNFLESIGLTEEESVGELEVDEDLVEDDIQKSIKDEVPAPDIEQAVEDSVITDIPEDLGDLDLSNLEFEKEEDKEANLNFYERIEQVFTDKN